MSVDIISRAADGCHHPRSEEELAALVRHARANGRQLRVMGSTHSVWKAIVTDGFDGPATPDGEMTVVLDRYTKVFDPKPDAAHPDRMQVEVQAGCHLGASPERPVQGRIDPGGPRATDVRAGSPWHEGAWDASLTSQLFHKWKLALSDLGGISHQTVSGFISTGSAGGTTKWSVHAGIAAMRVIDGEGNVTELREEGPDPDWFRAAGIAMGLCGVISTVTFRCEPFFDVVGSETLSAASQCNVLDFYGDRPAANLPTLDKFLVDTDYTRLMWWPQFEFDRLVVWQANRAKFDPATKIVPYHEIATFPVLSQIAASVLLTVLGNLDEPARALEQLAQVRKHPAVVADGKGLGGRMRALFSPPPDPDFPYEEQHLHPWLTAIHERLAGERHDPVTLASAWIPLIEFLVTGADTLVASALTLPILAPIFRRLAKFVPAHIGSILGVFVSAGENGAPVTQYFQDRSFLGLPMDNQMDDLLMPTWFTELWIPFTPGDGKVTAVVGALRRLFQADGTPEGAYAATGFYSFELYAAKADPTFFLSAANGTENVFRVDVFWFGRNAADPHAFYRRFWDALEPFGFRAHWGKFLPSPPDPARLMSRFPGFAKWKAVRDRVDPGNVFLTKYWRENLGL